MNNYDLDNFITTEDNIIPGSAAYNMVALKSGVFFPKQTSHFDINTEKGILAIEKANIGKDNIFIVSQKNSSEQNPSPKAINSVGVLAKIQQVIKLGGDNVRVLVTTLERMEIDEYLATSPYFRVSLKPFPVVKEETAELAAVKLAVKEQVASYIKLDGKFPKENAIALNAEDEKFIAAAATYLFNNDTERQAILEKTTLYEQYEAVLVKLVGLCEVLSVEKKISMKVRESVDKNQKEYYLREQLKAIHDELGDGEDERLAVEKRAKEKNIPEYAMEKLNKELVRMDKMNPSSPEAGVIRTYLEWMLDLPWNEKSVETSDLIEAKRILDEDHYGLEKVKQRILEYLAVHTLSGNLKGAILCFVGPPGVGKTSIVTSIARASGRKLVQMSLGGVRDEAEIRGHRRTYVGAMPGRILNGMKNAGTVNPVFLLDEIDKMSSDFRGDPASAMLEVLDPNQNAQFKDHYLEIPYDLSSTMFVCTANTLDTIAPPLLDRMEVIELTGYTYEEKLQIAKRYLIPKQAQANGLKPESVSIPDDVINDIVVRYTRESGVRNLEREIASVMRKIAYKTVVDNKPETNYEVTENDLPEFLGVPKYKAEQKGRKNSVGEVTGLAWTRVGGVTLNIEAILIGEGKGNITLTGNMGDVMKESAQTAFSLVRSRAEKYNIDTKKFTNYDVHIHIPEGATPKDGPSAGITLSTAILSALSGLKVRADVAMTGEITLLGNVLAIGGLKEKSLAAMRAGVKTLIIPKENEKDIQDIPSEVKSSLKIVVAETIDDVFDVAIVKSSKKEVK